MFFLYSKTNKLTCCLRQSHWGQDIYFSDSYWNKIFFDMLKHLQLLYSAIELEISPVFPVFLYFSNVYNIPFFFFFFCCLIAYEVSGPGVQSKLKVSPTVQLWQCQILNPVSEARDQTSPPLQRHHQYHCTRVGIPMWLIFK